MSPPSGDPAFSYETLLQKVHSLEKELALQKDREAALQQLHQATPKDKKSKSKNK